MTTPSGIAYINQEFVLIEEAKISVLDWGFLRSDATYDVAHVWKGRFFRLDAHIDRFLASAQGLHLSLPVNRTELKALSQFEISKTGIVGWNQCGPSCHSSST